ncbi:MULTISPECIES: phage tail protein [Mesorhizobium]|uniref:Phage tail protein n=4 Tax=Mesorhizobium TaxID=68287 RepID=A0A1A5I2X6_RHILI|nr:MULTISPECIES: tail fiber protein [Mesorhizobium]MBE1710542.1 phage tail protein [Mesorhizobium japonicum]MBE1712440.1 phage tail protein [Mesorhizobium japonicum]MUT22821.1 phage tail protein [Mesorhizobium japonicum]MUT29272.1 phage tail protein [Mesorhizobium japonicum]OBP73212.1 phage tail protein [Mesorhizobium loti]
MSDQFVAEIRIFPFDFAPTGWATCDGQLMPISQNTALFSLLGTTYGGDGKSTFALPDMQGNAPMQPGQAAGGSDHFLGETGGSTTVTLLQTEMPQHVHSLMAAVPPALLFAPSASTGLARSAGGPVYQTSNANLTPLNSNAVQPTGGDLPHNNMMPYLTLNFCIALQGIFPARP